MRTIPLSEAGDKLEELVTSVSAGEEIILTRDEAAVAKLVPAECRPSLREIRPASVGAVLKPFELEDDLLDAQMPRTSRYSPALM